MSIASAAPEAYNVVIVPTPEVPPRRELSLPEPTFSRCNPMITQDGDNVLEMIVESKSNRTWRLERSIMTAYFGEIWLATEVKIQDGRCVELYDDEGNVRQFAVKRMPWEKINNGMEIMAENPLNEIAALSIVSYPGHPNVLQLEAALDDGETAYLVTPFIGGDMFDWDTRMRDLNVEKRMEIMRSLFRQLMEGLMYIHSKGICHADISLENVLIDWRAQRLYIIGFGMSFLMPINGDNRRYMSVPDGRKAKASYCSPETLKGKEPYDGVKVDVFAAGAMFFIMLTGIPPFAKASRADRRFKKLVYEGDVEGVINQLRVPPIGDQAVDLLKKMMAYRAEDRPLPEQVLQHPWMTP